MAYTLGKALLEKEKQTQKLQAEEKARSLSSSEQAKLESVLKAFEPFISPQVKVKSEVINVSSLEVKLDQIIDLLSSSKAKENQALDLIITELQA